MKRLLLVMLVACGGKTAATVPAPPPNATSTSPAPEPIAKPEAPKMPTQTAQPQNLEFPNEDFRAHQPAATAPRPFKLPPVKPFTLANGISVYLVEQHTLPIVSMDLNFDGGSLVDPKQKDGMASVCMSMLTEGTKKLDKIAYSEALADIASNINAYATDDSQGVQLSSLTKHLDTTFALFADTIHEPGLQQSDFDRMIKRRIEGVRQARTTPTAIPGRVFGPIVYGPDHPLGSITTEDSLSALKLDDCKSYLANWLKPGKARLFVVGDLTEQQLRALFEKSSLGATWKGNMPAMPKLAATKHMEGRIFFVHVPKAAQSTVMLVHEGPRRTDPDYFANTMVSAVLGGSFTSRINMNLREDKGYSYGARGGFGYPLKQLGTLTVSAPVQATATYQTVLEVAKETRAMASGSAQVTKDELEREKTNAILALPSRFATAQAALGQYRGLVYYGLPLSYYNSYVDQVTKVTEAQTKQSASRHLLPDKAVFIVVGDGDAEMNVRDEAQKKDVPLKLTLREALAQLAAKGEVGKGGLVELDVDGKPVKK